ncbi:MAG: Rieske 2Fe-2S domain-containing protein [Gammaproteobacteria bacterium]|nr:Rieske 2Fe-2S domain-containing protein [Gammaproteobacteria bacterium]
MATPTAELGPALQSERKRVLIDATMTAIAAHGLSGLTLAKVGASAGITAGSVSFHFASKEALLLATLRYVGEEFEAAVQRAQQQAGADPAARLAAVLEVSLEPALTEPRKIAVWYAFMAETRARADYQQICGERDTRYSEIVQTLCTELIGAAGRHDQLDTDAIAFALVGFIDELWQEILFQGERWDRKTALRRCRAFLASVFPWCYDMPGRTRASSAPAPIATPALAPIEQDGLRYTLPAWIYDHAEYFELEAEQVHLPAWHVVCHLSELPVAGSYATFNLLRERAFVIRAEDGTIRAFHNSCRHRGHALAAGHTGRCPGRITCPYHAWSYALDGSLRGVAAPDTFAKIDKSRFGLLALECEIYHGFVFVRFRPGDPSVAERFAPHAQEFGHYRTADMVPWGEPWDEEIEVDWKNAVENYAEDYHFPTGHPGLSALMERDYDREVTDTGLLRLSHRLRAQVGGSWSVRLYHDVLPAYGHLPPDLRRRWTYYGLFPSTCFDLYPESMDTFQMLPAGPGRMRIRAQSYVLPDERRETVAARILSLRINREVQHEDNALIRSVQGGLASSGYRIGVLSAKEICVQGFQDWLRARLPVVRLLEAPPPGTVREWNARLAAH